MSITNGKVKAKKADARKRAAGGAKVRVKPKEHLPPARRPKRTRGEGAMAPVKPMPHLPPPPHHLDGPARAGPTEPLQPMSAVAETCAGLVRNQRVRVILIKSRVMQSNRLQAVVAGALGYESRMSEAERKKKFQEAARVIARTPPEPAPDEWNLGVVIRTTLLGIRAFEQQQAVVERHMAALARALPVYGWSRQPDQRGFGLSSLAVVVGEAGDLANYANPGKLWRRFGLAPFAPATGGPAKMGATWRKGREGKLAAEEWEAFGYSPRRRSVAYLIGENLLRQNYLKLADRGDEDAETEEGPAPAGHESECGESGDETEGRLAAPEADGDGGGDATTETESTAAPPGPYRLRYLEAKCRAALAHPDWSPKRCHLHGMLLATKLLLKNLWVEWNRGRAGESRRETDGTGARPAERRG